MDTDGGRDLTMGKILAVCLSEKTGTLKLPIPVGNLIADMGLEGDAHAGTGRQVSLICLESLRKMEAKGLEVKFGMFAENLVVEGMRIEDVEMGQRYVLPSGARLEVSGIGKVCHSRCAIYDQVGDCIMPREGFFARVVQGGEVKAGDVLRRDSVRP
jgi:MOSC domain-containing protein YiiM